MDKPFAITLDVGSSLANKTGSWREERPVYVHRMPPCNQGCPAGENIQQWLYHAESGDYEAAWRELVKDNPLPAVMGRVCYHPCETVCNRAQLDEAVGIHGVERFLGDEAIRQGWQLDPRRRADREDRLDRGRGPVGPRRRLPARTPRARRHDPRRCSDGRRDDALRHPPLPAAPRRARRRDAAHRRPRRDARAERKGHEHPGSDAATAASTPRSWLSARTSASAPTFRPARRPTSSTPSTLLRSMEGEQPPLLGRRVVVYGGGDTAMDAARTAKRLGASDAIVVYRRTRERMPAHDFEVEEALEEGVRMKWLSTIRHAREGELLLEKMELDEHGFPQPTGQLEELRADSLVLALGQEADLSLLDGVPGLRVEDGVVQVDERMMTGHEGIFAGGDMVPSERTVTVGVGHGKQAARNIDAWLRQAEFAHPPAARARRLRDVQHLVLRRRASHRRAEARHRPPAVELRRGQPRSG